MPVDFVMGAFLGAVFFAGPVFVFLISGAAATADSAAVFTFETRVGRVEVVVEALAFVIEAAFLAAAFFGGIVAVVLVVTRRSCGSVQDVLGGW